MTLQLSECVSSLTPSAVVGLSWRYAWSLINARLDGLEQAAGEPRERVELVPREGGGYHAPGISKLYGMFGR